jgi:hypothetical protein
VKDVSGNDVTLHLVERQKRRSSLKTTTLQKLLADVGTFDNHVTQLEKIEFLLKKKFWGVVKLNRPLF